MVRRGKSIIDLIGNTPVVQMNRLVASGGADVWLKLEAFNPGGSVKDRIAMSMIDQAEKDGEINRDTLVIEPTSGNTGIGLAMVLAARRMKLILVMPESMSPERRKVMTALGAEIVLTPADKGMEGAMGKAREIKEKQPNSFIPGQFDNPANPEIHARTTAREIIEQLDRVDVLVAGVGTGGTLSGAGRVLKELWPELEIVAVEPAESPVLTEGKAGPHEIQGIGPGFVPAVLDREIIDRVAAVKGEEAKKSTRDLARLEGILAGISTGAALHIALREAEQRKKGETILVIAPDGGEKYLSTDLFAEGEGDV